MTGKFDFDKLHDQLAQFFDLKDIKIAGTSTFEIGSAGNGSTGQPIDTHVNLAIQNLALTLPDRPAISLVSLNLFTHAKVDLASNTIQHADVSFQTGDGKNTIIDFDLDADGINPDSKDVKRFDLNRCNVMQLAAAPKELDPFISALRDLGIRISDGQLYVNVSGSYDGTTRTIRIDPENPLALSTPNLTVQKVDDAGNASDLVHGERITASIDGEVSAAPGGAIAADIRTLSIDTQHKIFGMHKSEGSDFTFKRDGETITGSGSVSLSADVKAMMDIARRFGGEITVQTASAGQLTSGQLEATVALSRQNTPETSLTCKGR